MNRRIFSLSALAAPFAAAFGSKSATAAEGPFEMTSTDAEWRVPRDASRRYRTGRVVSA